MIIPLNVCLSEMAKNACRTESKLSEDRRNRGEAGEAGWCTCRAATEDHEQIIVALGQEAGDDFSTLV
jgi:hypothetical protein